METVYYKSPLGPIKIQMNSLFVERLEFVDKVKTNPKSISKFAERVLKEIDEYFLKNRKTFSFDFNLEGTPFQKSVWNELKNVGFSETVSYKDIAKKIKRPKAMRAVGAACGRNPVAIMIPCHRIISANGDLTGYDGGLWRKKWLLRHEKPKAIIRK